MGACFSPKGAKNETNPPTTTSERETPNNKNGEPSAGKGKGEIKMLLLGAGESGKSTIWKQMKLIHLEGFNDEEKEVNFKPNIVENVIQLLQGLVGCIHLRDEQLLEQNKEFGALLLRAEGNAITYQEYEDKYPQLRNLWSDPKIQETTKDSTAPLSLVLLDSAEYWYKNIDRILADDYKPTVEDIIKSRTKTTGIQEIVFEIDGYSFKLTDVGGQRSERKKWIACFQNLTAILFVVALSEYDQTLNEDSQVNRMTESIKLFRGVVGNDALHHVSMILFLNKEDLFMEKINRSDLKKCFPDFPGPNTKEAAFEYIKDQFVSLNTNPNRKIYTQITVATDIDNIRQAMENVREIVVHHALSGGKSV